MDEQHDDTTDETLAPGSADAAAPGVDTPDSRGEPGGAPDEVADREAGPAPGELFPATGKADAGAVPPDAAEPFLEPDQDADAFADAMFGERVEEVAGEPVAAGSGSGPGEPLVDAQLKAIIEALVFASPDPLTLKAMTKVLDGEGSEAIAAAVEALKRDYARAGGLQMVEVAGGFQIVTRPDLNEWVRRLFHERTSQKLSVAALETLAVIAYKQPITAAEITDVRGVNTSGVLGTLMDRKLVKITGRKPVVGRPFMYATTREFLNRFGLRDLNDLPKVEDMADALGFEPPLLEDVATTAALPFDGDPGEPAAREPEDEDGAPGEAPVTIE